MLNALQELPLIALIAISTGIFSLRMLIMIGAITLLVRTHFAQARRIYRVDFGEGQFRSELRAGALVIAFDALAFAIALRFGLFAFGEVTAASVAWTFGALFVWYEIWFYVTHWLVHRRWLYFVHEQHHVAKVTHPLTSISFSLGERLILQIGALGFPAILSHHVPVALPGFMAYFLFNYFFTVVIHSNIELLPAGYPRTRIGRLFISNTFHSMHHARFRGHYGLFTQVLDRAFGTYLPDYPEVHARAARGAGMQRIGERELAID